MDPDESCPGTDDGDSTPIWWALRTGPNRCFRVRDALRERGIEEFLPTVTEESRWTDRRKAVTRPLLPGYVFARTPPSGRREIAAIPGVLAAIGSVEETEILNLRCAMEAAKAIAPCPFIAGDAVTVARGPLAGVSGVVVHTKGATRLVIAISILRRAVSVQIDASDLEKGKR